MGTLAVDNIQHTDGSSAVTLNNATITTGIIPAAGVTGVLPVGVTGGSGLTSVPGASWVKLEEVTASSSTTVTIGSASIFSSTYDLYCIKLTGLKCSAGGHTLRCRYFLGGTLSQSSGDYRWTNERYYSTTESITGSQSDNLFDVHTNWNTAIQEGGDTILFGMLYLHNPADTDIMTFFEGTTMSGDGSNRPTISRFGVFNNQAGGAAEIACTGLRFFQSSGNLNSGKFVIYGIKD